MSHRPAFLPLLAIIATLALSGCGDPLDSRYGVTDAGSINGLSLFHALLTKRTNLRSSELIGPRLREDGELLIHVARWDRLPDDEACTWLEDWLLSEDYRQAVVILRGGTLTSWLCRRWADEARAEAARGGLGAAALNTLAEQLERRAASEEDDTPALQTQSCPLFSVRRHAAVTPLSINGLELERVPQAMQVTGAFRVGSWPEPEQSTPQKPSPATSATTVEKDDADVATDDADEQVVEPLITLRAVVPTEGGASTTTDVAWAITIPYGESRLVLVLDALPLLDGAQPDPAARRLLTALTDHITGFHDEQPHTTWVRHLRVRGHGGPPNPMLAVLTSAPVSYISWHFVAFLVVLALAGAAWLGRREAPAETRHDRFSRHVLALASRLRDGGYATWCARAIARATLRHRAPPPPLSDDAEARRWLLSLTDTPTRPPVSPRGPHDERDSSDA